MSDRLMHTDRDEALEEAAEWLARRDRGLSPEERAEMREWAQLPGNQQALKDMAHCWHGMDAMSELAELFPLGAPAQVHRSARRVPLSLLAAAVACVLIVSAIFVAGRRSAELAGIAHLAQSSMRQENGRYSTSVGESLTVTPADGSIVTLNTRSALSVSYSAQSRDVFLDSGEASFEVAHDSSRPFKVHVGERVLQAVGTSFNVRVLPSGSVELTVTEGKVKLLQGGSAHAPDSRGGAGLALVETTVAAQEIATMQGGAESVRRLEPAELDAHVAWQRGMLIFKGETLDFVLAEVDRYTDSEFVLEDEALRTVRVGGYFRTGDIEGLLVALRTNFAIDSRRDGANRIVLSAAPAR